ncbi:MAG TPA: putative Ig domain-containing protein [Phycisphaerae bacterium]|nr:putative Ig domain-containing protein [Phycisphaerae bacterium]
MPEESVPAQCANWKWVLVAAAFVGAGLALSHTLQAGEAPESASDEPLQTAQVDVQFGAGQPPEFYEQNFGRPDPNQGPVIACFAQGTDERVVAHFNEMLYVEPTDRYQLTSRWTGAQGTPRALTWSFVPDGLSIPSGIGEAVANSDLFARMDALFAAQGGRATWINRFQQSFDRWAQICGTSYTRITVGGNDWDDGAAWGSAGSVGLRGDIRICMKNLDGANGVLAYNFFPSGGLAPGDMVLDRSEGWGSSSNQHRFLRNTVMHEHGHGLGILHVCPINGTKLMEPFLNTGFDGLRHDDIRGGQRHYGDIYESNNTAGTATNIGTLIIGTPINLGALPAPPAGTNPANSSTLSIDANAKNDYYRFHVDTPVLATVTVTPQGLTYLNAAQNGDGSCPAGTNVNSLAIADLVVEIRDTNGVTVLGTANATGAGSAETLANVNLPIAGDYYVQVLENNTPTESQLYTMSLSAAASCPAITVDPASLPNGTVNAAYNQALSASGGTGPYTFAVTSGSLPAGLSLSLAGIISGTPIGLFGPSNFTVTATDSIACTGNRAYSITIDCPVEDISPASIPDAAIGVAYNQVLSGVGGIAPYTFIQSGGILPSELSVSAAGVISGTPVDAIGLFNFDVESTDAAGCTATRSYSLNIACGLLGDVNNDGFVDSLDIQGFTDCVLGFGSSPGDYCGCADMDQNGLAEELDMEAFVDVLVP